VDHFGLHGVFDVEIRHVKQGVWRGGRVVAGKKAIIDLHPPESAPFLFSSAVTPADTAACLAAVDLLEESEDLVHRLWDNAATSGRDCSALGFDTGRSQTPSYL